jgi:hypothetical protein
MSGFNTEARRVEKTCNPNQADSPAGEMRFYVLIKLIKA